MTFPYKIHHETHFSFIPGQENTGQSPCMSQSLVIMDEHKLGQKEI